MVVLFQINGISFYTHGIFFVLAMLAVAISLYFLIREFTTKQSILVDLISWSLIFGILGARIAYFIIYRNDFNSILDFFKLQNGGLISWGGYIAGLATVWLILRAQKEDLKKWFDAIFVSGLLGIAVGRAGCVLSGEIAGKTFEGFLSIGGRFPTALFEGTFALLAYVILIHFYNEYKISGLWWKVSLLAYALGRFFIDFTRQESIYYYHLSLGQIFALGLVVMIVILLLLPKYRKGENQSG